MRPTSLPQESRICYTVLLTAAPEARAGWRALFAHEALADWEVIDASSLEQAHFVLQHGHSDVWLVDHGVCRGDDGDRPPWLTCRHHTPVLLVADLAPALASGILEWGCDQWLARDLARQPELLAVALRQTLRSGEVRQQLRRTGDDLRECRQRITRLADMLWESVPGDSRNAWQTQRRLLRLQEEIDRSERHRTPLALVLGEVDGPRAASRPEDARGSWAVGLFGQNKRRCDVVGQHGPNGFMVLLIQTPAEGAAVFCQRLRQVLRDRAADPGGPGAYFRLSFGVAGHVPDANATQLLGRAEWGLEQTQQAEEGDPEGVP
jgi:hypothetical protein